MATIVLQAAGAWLGGTLGAVGSAIGSAAGAVAGYMVDRALLNGSQRYEGPRLSAARLTTAEEGSPLARVYGTARVGGVLIWSTRFKEEKSTSRQGGKWGPKTTNYSYYANGAFAVCEGKIAGIRRIWADGREIDRSTIDIRIYTGDEDQSADPLIEAKQGSGNAPAYRGTAYVVIDHFPIDDYGRRIPQFQFEVMRPVGNLHHRIRSVALLPGSTEYGLSSSLVTQSGNPGETLAVNRHSLVSATDFEASLDELQALCPNLESISIAVTWFGSDLRASECEIKPKVMQRSDVFSLKWAVSGVTRGEAELVSLKDGKAAYGGTPSDQTVIDAIMFIKSRGLKVTLNPFMMMDIPVDNGLADPYGNKEQPSYPWRGRITCHPAPGVPETVDKTSAVNDQIAHFVGLANPTQFSSSAGAVQFNGKHEDWGYRRFILHYAKLAAVAGGVDGFLIGSEMRGITAVRNEKMKFPFVKVLEQLAGEVRTIIGGETIITYGADWSEYFGYQPSDGSQDVYYHLDTLWAHPDVNCVGINNYLPLSDWRDDDANGSNPDGFGSPYDIEALQSGITCGEGFDWYYRDLKNRAERVRDPITDLAYNKPWVFRPKDFANWWSNLHYNRLGGVEDVIPVPGCLNQSRFGLQKLVVRQ